LFSDQPVAIALDDGLVECLHARRHTRIDDFVEGFTFGFSMQNGVLDTKVRAHDFQRGQAPTADFR
jgi:hypothetical protein